jgi:hypothetical protein
MQTELRPDEQQFLCDFPARLPKRIISGCSAKQKRLYADRKRSRFGSETVISVNNQELIRMLFRLFLLKRNRGGGIYALKSKNQTLGVITGMA